MKKCNKCEQIRTFEEYKKDPRNKDGRQGICIPCVRNKEAERRAARINSPITPKEKTCNRCKKSKISAEFYRDSAISDGISTICKECRNVSMTKWRDENRDKYNSNMREMRATQKERFKNIDLKRTYGISLEDYNNILGQQKGVCRICSNPPAGKRPLVVDHDHDTLEVRGLLCYKCNRDMVVVDDPDHLVKLIAYRDKNHALK